MAGPPHPCAVERDLAALDQLAQRPPGTAAPAGVAFRPCATARCRCRAGPAAPYGRHRACWPMRAAQPLPGRRAAWRRGPSHARTYQRRARPSCPRSAAAPRRGRARRHRCRSRPPGPRAARANAAAGSLSRHGGDLGAPLGRAPSPLGARRSISTPPPTVRLEEVSRMTKRSPAAAAIGRSSTSCTNSVSPGPIGSSRSTTTRPGTSAAAWCTLTGNHCPIGLGSEASTRRLASMRAVGACSAGSRTTSPRRTASLLICRSARARARIAVRPRPAPTGRFWAWIERTRASSPDGLTRTRSSTRTTPDSTVPVTAVPSPASVKERSTARRKRPSRGARWSRAQPHRDGRASASSPAPVTAETGRSPTLQARCRPAPPRPRASPPPAGPRRPDRTC